MELEICTYTVRACRIAQQEGADRVELCSAVREGGLTPSVALMEMVREAIDIQLFVMIRPRGGDFLYSDEEFEQMKREIVLTKKVGADGVVIGLLNPDGSIDLSRTRELVELASPMEVTFHRAFDMVADPSKALEDLIEAGCKRVLTSGGRNSAPDGIEWLTQLSTQANGRIKIMAGSGVNASNARSLMDAGVHALHLSGSSVYEGGMTYRNPNVSMSTASHLSEYQIVETDPAKVKAMRDVMNEKK